jgi:cystathionine beta-lyase
MSHQDDPVTTGLIHHPYRPPAGFEAVPPAVCKASTVIFRDTQALRQRSWKSREAYTYGLHGTPTTFTLEERIATLEGGRHCVLVPSGLAGITLVNLALLRRGDEVLLPHNVYGPSREQARTLLDAMGVGWREYDAMDAPSLAAMMTPATRLVWLEAPGSVSMEFPDLRALVQAVHAGGALAALDSTWAGGVAFRPFDMGIDISMHALTKYPSGGADVLMGAIVTQEEDLAHRILQMHGITGTGVSANDAEFILRSLPTLRVRYEAHDAVARELARWLQQQPMVTQVLHPALPGSPGHAHWRAHCTAAAGLFSVMVDERHPQEQVDRFVDALRLFKIGYSWGGPVSLAVPYDIQAMRSAGASPKGRLVRLSIGLEALEDLRADLSQALKAAFG